MKNIAVFYGSDTGNTKAAAENIAGKLQADIFDVAHKPAEKLAEYNNLIFGSSTMGIGDLQDDWDGFVCEVEKADLNGKVIAIFGLGDGDMYADSFVDGIGTIYKAIKDKGCKIVGHVDTSGYDFDESIAVIGGKFVGLPLDSDNQNDLTDARIESWVQQIKGEFN